MRATSSSEFHHRWPDVRTHMRHIQRERERTQQYDCDSTSIRFKCAVADAATAFTWFLEYTIRCVR